MKINKYNMEFKELVNNIEESIRNILWLRSTQFYKHESYAAIFQKK